MATFICVCRASERFSLPERARPVILMKFLSEVHPMTLSHAREERNSAAIYDASEDWYRDVVFVEAPGYVEQRRRKSRRILYIFGMLALCFVIGGILYAVANPNPFEHTHEETP
jgi:hypothetical protein